MNRGESGVGDASGSENELGKERQLDDEGI